MEIFGQNRLLRSNPQINKGITMANFKVGYYLIEKDVGVGFGSWGVTFKKGQVLKYDNDQKMWFWDTNKNDWKLKAPPISDEQRLDLSKYASQWEQENVLKKFNDSVKVLTKKQAEELVKMMNINDVELLIKKAGIEVVDGMVKKSDIAKIIEVIKSLK